MIYLLVALVFFTQVPQKQKELEQLKNRLHEVRQEIKQLDKEKAGTLTRIEKIDEGIGLASQYINELTTQENQEKLRVQELTRNIAGLEAKMRSSQADLRERLVRLYTWTPFYRLEVLFSGKSLPQILSTSYYLQILAKNDEQAFFEFKSDYERYIADKRMREDLIVSIEDRRKEKEGELEILNGERRDKNKILDQVAREAEKKKALEKELKSAQRKLEELIVSLEKKREKSKTTANYLEINQGKLGWPCNGSVTTKFGKVIHPKYNTTTKNNGIDIASNYGDNVYAVAPGKVVYAGRFMGYGNMVLLDHRDGYYSLYGHLSELLVTSGTDVERGRIVGRVGESGSLSGPILHFELRKDGKPVDPLLYLE